MIDNLTMNTAYNCGKHMIVYYTLQNIVLYVFCNLFFPQQFHRKETNFL